MPTCVLRATARGSAEIRNYITTLEAVIDVSALEAGDYQLALETHWWRVANVPAASTLNRRDAVPLDRRTGGHGSRCLANDLHGAFQLIVSALNACLK